MNITLNPLVSVIMPAYNAESTIIESLRSLSVQTFFNFEVLIIDDGSSDNTAKCVSEFCAIDNRFQMLRKRNGGIVKALNFGLDNARGAYIARLDADDIAHEDWLSYMIKYLDKNLELNAASCGYTTFGACCERTVLHPQSSEIVQLLLCYCSPISHPGSVWRLNSLRILRYTEGAVAEDHDLWCKMVEFGLKIGNINRVLIKYRIGRDSLSSKNRTLIKYTVCRRGLLYFYRQIHSISNIKVTDILAANKVYEDLRIWPAFIFLFMAKTLKYIF